MSVKIKVENISKKFEFKKNISVEVLKNVSFSLENNNFLAVIGPNGCGKTTLLYIIAGFLKPTKGQIWHDEELVTSANIKRTVVFQEYGLFPWMTIRENIAFGLKMRGTSPVDRKEISKRYIELLHLGGFEDKYPHQLSGGMKQRVSIARALATDPDVVLMDEPFAALDSLTREIMQEEVSEICEKSKKTFLLITHNIEEAIFLGDKVLIMTARPGQIKEIIDINLPYPRKHKMKSEDSRFLELKEHISQSVREEVQKTIGEEGVRLSKVLGSIKLEKEK